MLDNPGFTPVPISVLFSEPKIPQSQSRAADRYDNRHFSALQRAENSSMVVRAAHTSVENVFQCSSASRKFLNPLHRQTITPTPPISVLFSEPKIPQSGSGTILIHVYDISVLFSEPKIPQFVINNHTQGGNQKFQCSSASRKFLNPDPRTCVHPYFRPR